MEVEYLRICRGDPYWCGYRILSLDRCGTASPERHDPGGGGGVGNPIDLAVALARGEPLTTSDEEFYRLSRIEAVKLCGPAIGGSCRTGHLKAGSRFRLLFPFILVRNSCTSSSSSSIEYARSGSRSRRR